MTKKDYVTFARMIRTQRQRIMHTNNIVQVGSQALNADEALHAQLDSIAEGLADIFGNDNANFHRGKFMQACEIDTESK